MTAGRHMDPRRRALLDKYRDLGLNSNTVRKWPLAFIEQLGACQTEAARRILIRARLRGLHMPVRRKKMPVNPS